jgi:hypothetical protein
MTRLRCTRPATRRAFLWADGSGNCHLDGALRRALEGAIADALTAALKFGAGTLKYNLTSTTWDKPFAPTTFR